MLFLWICSTLVSHVPSKCIGNRIKKGIKEILGEKKQFLKLIEYRNIAKMSFPFMYKFKVSAELFRYFIEAKSPSRHKYKGECLKRNF